MSLFKTFATDVSLEKTGVHLNYGKNDRGEDILITVRRAGGANKQFAQLLNAKMRPYRRQVETQTMDQSVSEAIMREVYAEAVVVGWQGVEDEAGNPMEFSVQNCKELFERLPDFFRDVAAQASDIAAFRVDAIQVAEKN